MTMLSGGPGAQIEAAFSPPSLATSPDTSAPPAVIYRLWQSEKHLYMEYVGVKYSLYCLWFHRLFKGPFRCLTETRWALGSPYLSTRTICVSISIMDLFCIDHWLWLTVGVQWFLKGHLRSCVHTQFYKWGPGLHRCWVCYEYSTCSVQLGITHHRQQTFV